MNLINTVTLEYPRSLWQLRQANPNVSFPANPTDDDLAPFDHANVHPTPQPSYDARTERIEEATPAPDADGIYHQQWDIRAATETEITAYDLAHAPAPDWIGFGMALARHQTVTALYAAIPTPISNALSIGLNEAGHGNLLLFTRVWQQLLAAGAITPELLATVAALAAQYNLPAQFIAGLAPTAPEPVRARDEHGRFIEDDPSTPDINEV